MSADKIYVVVRLQWVADKCPSWPAKPLSPVMDNRGEKMMHHQDQEKAGGWVLQVVVRSVYCVGLKMATNAFLTVLLYCTCSPLNPQDPIERKIKYIIQQPAYIFT